jgi:hypothetical protein
MPKRAATLYPFDNSGPDAVEAQFASQIGSNPLAPAWLVASQLNREGLRNANNQQATEYMSAQAEQQAAQAEATNRMELLKSMFAQQQLAPDAMSMMGGDPTNAQNFLESAINKASMEGYQSATGGAKNLAEAGMPQTPDLFSAATGIQTTQGTPISTTNAQIAADASRDAAAIRSKSVGASGKPLKTGQKQWYDAQGVLRTAYEYGKGTTGVDAILDEDGNVVGQAPDDADPASPMQPTQALQGTTAAEGAVADKGFDIIPGKTQVVTRSDGTRVYRVQTHQGPKDVAADAIDGSQ